MLFYIDRKTCGCEDIPAAVMDRLAEFYDILVTDLLDLDNYFLYMGQVWPLADLSGAFCVVKRTQNSQ